MIEQHLDKVSAEARAAWKAIQIDGAPRKTAPNPATHPHQWAAWQAHQTSIGVQTASATKTLMAQPYPVKRTWEDLYNLIGACRLAIVKGYVRFEARPDSASA